MRSRAVPTWRIYLSALRLSIPTSLPSCLHFPAVLLVLPSASRVFLPISSQLSSTLPLSRHSVKAREGERK